MASTPSLATEFFSGLSPFASGAEFDDLTGERGSEELATARQQLLALSLLARMLGGDEGNRLVGLIDIGLIQAFVDIALTVGGASYALILFTPLNII